MISVRPAVSDSATMPTGSVGRQDPVDDRGDREERGQPEEDPGLDVHPALGGLRLLGTCRYARPSVAPGRRFGCGLGGRGRCSAGRWWWPAARTARRRTGSSLPTSRSASAEVYGLPGRRVDRLPQLEVGVVDVLRDGSDLEVHRAVVGAAELRAAADEGAGVSMVFWKTFSVWFCSGYGNTSRLNRKSIVQNEWMTSLDCSWYWIELVRPAAPGSAPLRWCRWCAPRRRPGTVGARVAEVPVPLERGDVDRHVRVRLACPGRSSRW